MRADDANEFAERMILVFFQNFGKWRGLPVIK